MTQTQTLGISKHPPSLEVTVIIEQSMFTILILTMYTMPPPLPCPCYAMVLYLMNNCCTLV